MSWGFCQGVADVGEENDELYSHGKVVSDLYFWKSAADPPLTYRMKKSEDRLDSLEQVNAAREAKKSTKENLILGAILTLLAGLVLAHFKII
jgi:hypothetical protein